MQNIDPDRLINHWWSNSLTLDDEDLIENSYEDPSPFWSALFNLHQKNRRSPPKSHLKVQYDFYHDCILRHTQSNDVAYSIVEKEKTANWTHSQLHRCVNAHVKNWSKLNLEPGHRVAIVLNPGIEFLIALLTALRFGLTLTLLPPNSPLLSKNLILNKIAEIKPRLIVKEAGTENFLKDMPHASIDPTLQDDEEHSPVSYSYKPDAPIQISLSLSRQEPFVLIPLDAQMLYMNCLRDGFLALNLRENTSWASPLSCPIRTEPCSSLMTLLTGARKVHVSDESISHQPDILQSEKIHLIGISAALQQLWSRTPAAPAKYLRAFYKNPFEIQFQTWKSFILLNKLEKVPSFQILMDNSTGGISLFSKPNFDPLDLDLKTSPATPWSLEVTQGSSPYQGYGIFNIHLPFTDSQSNLTLMKTENNVTLTPPLKPSQDGITFPLDTLEELVKSLPFVENCMLHPIPKLGKLDSKFFLLFVFVNPLKRDLFQEKENEWRKEMSQQILLNLGQAYLPDEIEFYPLLPKMHHGKIDRNWCTHHHNDGLFKKKMMMPVYATLHILKKLAQVKVP